MDHFVYRNNELFCEEVPVTRLAAEFGTPLYVYSRATLLTHYQRIERAFASLSPLICYSIKSCGNVHILQTLIEQGAGMDVVSGGELYRAAQAGADMSKVVYAGVGKTDAEIRQALAAGIGYFNVESEAEFENIAAIAKEMNAATRAALRVNPDVADPNTHVKTATGKKETKFGVDIERAPHFFQRYGRNEHLKLVGIHLHIGSPIYSPQPYVRAIQKVLPLIERLRSEGFAVELLNIGGGFAADYQTGKSPSAADYAAQIVPLLAEAGLKLVLEPGRTISGNAGILLSRVLYVKVGGTKKFIIIDSGENHLIRPAMYDAFHFIWPVKVAAPFVPQRRAAEMETAGLETVDVVGPICESGVVLAADRALPPLQRGDLLAVFTAGAYGMAMASNYNAMPRPAEVLVDGDQTRLIRRRETYDDLVAAETNL